MPELDPTFWDPIILAWLVFREGWAWLRRQQIRLRISVNEEPRPALDLEELSE